MRPAGRATQGPTSRAADKRRTRSRPSSPEVCPEGRRPHRYARVRGMTFFLDPRETPNQATLAASASGGSVVGELVVVPIDGHICPVRSPCQGSASRNARPRWVMSQRPPSAQTRRVYPDQHPRCSMRGSVSPRLGSCRLSTASLLHALLHRSRHPHQPAGRDADPGHPDLPLGITAGTIADIAHWPRWRETGRVLRSESWSRPAGESPVRVDTGLPGSRPRFVVERRRAERGVKSLFGGSKHAGRSVKRNLQPRHSDNGRAEPLTSRRRPRSGYG